MKALANEVRIICARKIFILGKILQFNLDERFTNEEIEYIRGNIAETIVEILRLRVKYKALKEEIDKQKIREEDYIYRDVYKFLEGNDEPTYSKTFEYNGIYITITKTHKEGTETFYGIDLIYEIEDEKFLLIQYKKMDDDKRLTFDRHQLGNLRQFCNYKCIALRNKNKTWFNEQQRIVSYCQSYYNLILDGLEIFLPACIIESILDSGQPNRKSANIREFQRGILKDCFLDLFSKCWIGAINYSVSDIKKIIDHLIEVRREVIYCMELTRQ